MLVYVTLYMELNMVKRNILIDFLKSISIILVVLGHCIQYGSGYLYLVNNNFFYNKLFMFIYSFHMPLFAAISGYLFYKSINKYSLKFLLQKKILRLIIPWGFFSFFYICCTKITFANFINTLVIVYWFIFSLIILYLITIIIKYLFKDSWIAHLFVFVISFFINCNVLNTTLYIYPFFMIGYFFNKYDLNKIYNSKKNIICIMSSIFFLVLLHYFNYSTYIYTSGYYILKQNINVHQILINIYRLFIGLTGTVPIISIVDIIIREKISKNAKQLIICLSKATLTIYFTSVLINVFILTKVTFNLSSFNWLYMTIEGIIVIGVCISINYILSTNKVTKILLGQ